MSLEPVDITRCQAEKADGVNAFTLGGRPRMVRCTNKPTTVAHEREPGPDGLRGAMSLCGECQSALIEQLGCGHCEFEPIPLH
jgi:hypothetical protein